MLVSEQGISLFLYLCRIKSFIMTKEQVFSLNLTPAEKERAEAYFFACERFKRPLEIEGATEKEIKDFLAEQETKYQKRKSLDKKRSEKLEPYFELKKFIVKNKNYITEELLNDIQNKVELEKKKAETKQLKSAVEKLIAKGFTKSQIAELL